jgi:Dioxygenase
VREDRSGVQLNLKMRVIGLGNCAPMQNVRVNIWHCDKDGNYSGYQTQAALKYLRGYQFTDANGEVEFVNIFPGWYNGRICHIHFQVYVSSAYAAVSQLAFDTATKNAIYAAHPSIYTKGADPKTFNNDNIFSDGYALQLATLTPNAATGGYSSYLEVAVQGNGVVSTGHLEKENAKRFALGQNFPNPYTDQTSIPFTLRQAAQVKCQIWNLAGQQVAEILNTSLGVGDHSVVFTPRQWGLPTGNYAYQLEISNSDGVFRDCRMMTAK